MSNPSAILTIAEDIRILPFWAEYHRHIFDSGTVVIDPQIKNREEIERIIRRLLPEWTITDSYPLNKNKDQEEKEESFFQQIADSFLSIVDMIFDSNPTPPIKIFSNEFLLDKVPLSESSNRYECQIREGSLPNNIVNFLNSIAPVIPGDNSCIKIAFLSETEKDQISSKITEMRNEIRLTSDYIYYLDAYLNSDTDWGEDRVILEEDTNLLDYTDFDEDGHCIFSMTPYNDFLKSMVESKVSDVTSRLETYHLNVSSEEHTKIINSMPWKKTESPELNKFAEYMETRVSDILGRRVKIFNDDIWVRICRPSSITETDYNPCHRDIYLDFYRNIVNVYIPIVGSNEKSSLAMQSGSHYWNEQDLVVTKGGAYFQNSGKKYSVDAILRSKQPLHMIRPNPSIDEFILFSPYLIHGCSSNDNTDTTRMSVEIRFIEDTEEGRNQEACFREFLAKRVWR